MADRQRRKQTANILLNNKAGDSRILSFSTKAPAADDAHVNSLKVSSLSFCMICNFLCTTEIIDSCKQSIIQLLLLLITLLLITLLLITLLLITL